MRAFFSLVFSSFFSTELDFENEASNQRRLRQIFLDKNITSVTVPKVFDDLCTRHILVSEWVDGKKLSDATKDQIAEATPLAQEAFLTQLFEVGFFHADPHPGMSETRSRQTVPHTLSYLLRFIQATFYC
jgi:predicted unusual protein kinase regulating ubiquinone biosynthesis (AarF/ABC1/UbiB family)